VRTKWLENEVNGRTKQLTQTTEELQEELKSRAEFSRTLAHELKTPLTPLLATSELMLLSQPQEPLLSYAKNINSGAQELNQRINDLLDLSRGQVNALKLNIERVNFKAILEDSVNYDKPIAKANGLTIDTQYSDSLSDACVDVKRIRQIILNLLDNAVKYTPSGGRIIVSAREQEGYIITSISDTGKGISSKDRVTLFQPYTSLSNKSNKKSGLGLGLSLCKMLVELHGGNIWLEESTGKGSTFVFSIPIQIKDRRVTNEYPDN
jgi:signal transduction histidine kinase